MEEGKYFGVLCLCSLLFHTLSWICLYLRPGEITDLYQLLMQFKLQIIILLLKSAHFSFSPLTFHR